MTNFSLNVFDMGTKEDPENPGSFIDIPEWYLDSADKISSLYTWDDTSNFKGPELPFVIVPKNVHINIRGNTDSRVPADVIVSEFGVNNPNRWNRKPFTLIGHNDLYTTAEGNHVWVTGGTVLTVRGVDSTKDMYNIYCELVKSQEDEEPFAKSNKDLNEDGEEVKIKLRSSEVLGFSCNPTRKKFGIRVSEKGSKSYCHYTSGPDADKYTREWIEGTHFCPVDTLDSTNFKITTEPSYDAVETNGNFMDDGRWEAYLAPRRYAYFIRCRHHQQTGSDSNHSLVIGDGDYTGFFQDVSRPWDDAASPPAWNSYTSYGVTDCVTHDSKNWANKGGPDVEPGNEGPLQAWEFATWEEVDATTLFNHSDHNVDALMDCQVAFTATYDVQAKIYDSTHYLNIFWGRLPSDFTESAQIVSLWGGTYGPFPETQKLYFWEWVYALIGGTTWQWVLDKQTALDIPWFETRANARSAWVDAGGSLEDAEKVVLCGANTSEMHIHQDDSDYTNQIAFEGTSSGSYGTAYGSIDRIRHGVYLDPINNTVPDDPIFNTYYGGTTDSSSIQYYGVLRLWKVIEDSAVWTDVISPMIEDAMNWENDATPASMIDAIPYGVALSPTMAGDIVAIFRKGSKVYYVWRRTNEDLDAVMMRQGQDDNTIHCSFESRHLNGWTDRCAESGYFPKNQAYLPIFEVFGAYGGEYADQFSGEASLSATAWATLTYYAANSKVTYGGKYYKAAEAHTSGASFLGDIAKWISLGTGSRKLTHVGRAISLEEYDTGVFTDEQTWVRAKCSGDGSVELAAPLYVVCSKERATLDYYDWENVGDGPFNLGKVSWWGASVASRMRAARSLIDIDGWGFSGARPFDKALRNKL